MNSELIEKLESASEGSRELDAEIAFALGWKDKEVHVGMGHGWKHWYTDTRGNTRYALPNWSSSLDAAISLIEEVLPTAGFMIETVKRSDDTRTGWSVSFSANYRTPHVETVHKSAPIALLIALLKALETGGDHE